MAEILGNKLCMESLQSDIQDVQWTVNDVMSRVGPIAFSSWKFPDKLSYELDMEQLLEMYSFSPDEPEENQVAHIALYELLIDRLVLMMQGTAVYLSQVQQTCKAEGNTSAPLSTSVGLAVKHFWAQLTNTQTLVQQMNSKSKTSAKRVSELEKELKKFSQQDSNTNSASPADNLSDISSNSAFHLKISPKPISIDESNKSSQTVETAFVPCEACEVVQKRLREPQVAHAKWLTYNDVCRWMAEQNKDVNRLCKHIDQMSATIDPLKAEVAAFQKETKQAEQRAKESEQELKLEKETQAANKLKEKETAHEMTLADLHRQKEELLRKHTTLEQELDQRKTQSTELQDQLKQSEAKSQQLQKDLEEKAAIIQRLDGAEKEATTLRQQLSETKSQLEVATKTLAKEQGKNKSAAIHNQQVQAKQESLSGRIQELTQENEELRDEVAGLEEEKQELQESLQETRLIKEELEKEKQKQEIIIKNLNEEKSKLEESISRTEAEIQRLESQLVEAKERERMIIEYPDLNGPVNPDLPGTGNIVLDMENQVKANTIRMQVLDEQNEGLKRSITKVLSMGMGRQASQKPQQVPEPVPLWDTRQLDSHSNQQMAPPPPSEPVAAVPQTTYTMSHTPVSKPPPQPLKPASNTSQAEFFTVGRCPSENSREKQSRPTSGKRGGSRGGGGGFVAVNSTSISAYKQIKKLSGQATTDVAFSVKVSTSFSLVAGKQSRPSSSKNTQGVYGGSATRRGSAEEDAYPTYVCNNCDKMYTKARDLDIHKSYCTG
ncbi:hypothetical protein BaRGS_00034304 [Batillaria attramentaria]|uniref:C2H2-type domain-containing protein n=1 Tax=Batillaria attramentaria TaxID=370345 RepID=A0ABD0JJ56_9CAEN